MRISDWSSDVCSSDLDESRYFIDYRYIGLDRKVQSPDFSASAIIAAHSASVTGDTDSRDWRIVAMSFSAGVAFISASVTGRASGATGLTATETHLPSVPPFFAVRDLLITPHPALQVRRGACREKVVN